MGEIKNSKKAIRLPLYIAFAITVGMLIGANMAGTSGSTSNLFKSLYKFRQVLTYIENDYVDAVSSDDLVESAIGEMLKKLDPHSVYIPTEELELTKSQLEGNFEGIGIEFSIFKDTIHVVTPLSGGPSERLGLLAGDKILKVDDKNVAGEGVTNREVITMLRGPKGSKVQLTILRKGEKQPLQFTIERDVIPQYSVDVSYMVNEEIGYIKVSRFSATTYMEFKEALNSLLGMGMQKLILDLTGNPGGYMDRAIDLVDELLPDKQMIVYTKGKESRYNAEHYSKRVGDFESGPVIVLVDEGSASASEIVSGALQDHDRALIVGRRSFGKGLVQMPISLNDGSELRLTISRYYTPSGRSIQKPYEGDIEGYHKEFYDRFQNGEMYTLDSMKVDNSLIYETDKGRVVYGGGGIMPDYFVPLDTSRNSDYLTKLFNSNTIQEFSLKYSDTHRKQLSKLPINNFISDFKLTDKILKELAQLAEENGVPYNDEEFNKSKGLISIYTRAYIGRNIWDNKAFYPIYNEQNEIFQKALTLIDEANRLANN